MTIKDIIEWLDYLRARPKTTIAAILVLICGSAAGKIIPEMLKPFWHLQGLYSGQAEGNPFEFCIKVYGTKVEAQMSWPTSAAPTIDYVEYKGEIKDDIVNLKWRRNPDHPHPDQGVAIITPESNGSYGGFWESTKLKNNRQEWRLKKRAEVCELRNWRGGDA